MPGKAGRISAHSQNGDHLLIGDDLCFNVGAFIRIGKTFALVQVAQVFVYGDQHILDEFDIAGLLADQDMGDYLPITLKVMVPSAGLGFPRGTNCNCWIAAFSLLSASKLRPR